MPQHSPAQTLVVFGASGMVGSRLLARLDPASAHIVAISRQPRPTWALAEERIEWRRGDLFRDPLLPHAAVAFSLGPLDGLVAWLTRESPRLRRIVALSSTSIHTKAASADAAERDQVARLRQGEFELKRWCAAHGAHWTVLRPTLIYAARDEGSLASFTALARRLGRVMLPASARGRRQPVHADDLAAACLAVVDRPSCFDRAYDLPGGETLAYRDMVQRLLAPNATVALLPDALFRLAAPLARRVFALRRLTPAVLDRMAVDLCFDPLPAERDFGWSPRKFAPD
jgi:nucleoside-diphosphate-sugar epimerase